jgi:hypothetical protein
MNAKEIISKIKATPIVQCGDTGDYVVSRTDHGNTYQGWKTEVYYWYVPANATCMEDLVKLEVSDIFGMFFVNPIDPITGRPMEKILNKPLAF